MAPSSSNQTFRSGGETVHAVVLRHASKFRWNAFLWGAGLKFANTFARRESAERWLNQLIKRYFPLLISPAPPPKPSVRVPSEKPPAIVRDPAYGGFRFPTED